MRFFSGTPFISLEDCRVQTAGLDMTVVVHSEWKLSRNWQCDGDHQNRKYLYLWNYDRHERNSNGTLWGFRRARRNYFWAIATTTNNENGNSRLDANIIISDCPLLSQVLGDTFYELAIVVCWVCHWNFDDICHTFGDISTSGFGSR